MASIAETFAAPRPAMRQAITPAQEGLIVSISMVGFLFGGLGITLHALASLTF